MKRLLSLLTILVLVIVSSTITAPSHPAQAQAITRIKSYNYPTYYIRHQNGRFRIDSVISPFEDSQFRIVAGLANGSAISFQSVNFPNSYLRHRNGEIWLDANDGSALFKADATWWRRPGLANSSWVSYESYNFPNEYIRHSNYYLWRTVISTSLDKSDATFMEESSSGFVVSEAQFNAWFPNRNGLYQYNNFISARSSYSGFAPGTSNNDKMEAAAFFAHVAHETSSLVYVNEIAGGVYCGGNAAYGCAAGQNYYGRGPLQLTWNYNYKMASTGNYYANGCCWEARMTPGVGADIWSNPNLVATDGVITWKAALWFWMNHGKDWDPAQPTVHDDIINISFGETTRDINGGLECGQPVGSVGYNQMMDRANIYGNFLSNLGGSDGRSRTC